MGVSPCWVVTTIPSTGGTSTFSPLATSLAVLFRSEKLDQRMSSTDTWNRLARSFNVSPACTSYTFGWCDAGAAVGIAIGLTIVLRRPSCTLPTCPPSPTTSPSALTSPRRKLSDAGRPRPKDAYPDSTSASSKTAACVTYRLTDKELPPLSAQAAAQMRAQDSSQGVRLSNCVVPCCQVAWAAALESALPPDSRCRTTCGKFGADEAVGGARRLLSPGAGLRRLLGRFQLFSVGRQPDPEPRSRLARCSGGTGSDAGPVPYCSVAPLLHRVAPRASIPGRQAGARRPDVQGRRLHQVPHELAQQRPDHDRHDL